jgi:membrane dipeptidase
MENSMEFSAKTGLPHRSTIVVDAHSDYPVHMLAEQMHGNSEAFKNEHLGKLRSAGVRFETVTVGGDFQLGDLDLRSPLVTLAIIDCATEQINGCDDAMLVQTADDLASLAESQRIGIMFALEGTAPVTPDLSLLRTYYRLGVRSVMLTHNERNWFADGCSEPATGGLSKLGRELVKEMNRMHMILDVSHSNERTFYDALELYSGTPIASHSNVRRLCDHVRNLTDEQIKAIAERSGVIGMNFLARFVDSDETKANADRLVDHIAYLGNLVGLDHVGLGPDYADYYMEQLAEWARKQNMPPIKFTAGLETVSDLPRLTETLIKRGFADSEIRQILGENFLRAYTANLSTRKVRACSQ